MGTSFLGANLTEVDFTASDLRGANFEEATMLGVNMTEADLSDALIDQAFDPGQQRKQNIS